MAGNRCGHDRQAPRLTVKVKHTPLAIISKITKKMGEYFYNPEKFPGLNSARKKSILECPRRRRSERREAVVQVMAALLHYTDLATMRVGFYKDDGFQPLGIRYFVKLTGLSESRFSEALADINAAGLITTHTRCRKDKSGNYIGLNAVRRVSPKLFELFGLGAWLHKQRKKCSGKLMDKIEKISIAKFASLSMLSTAFTHKHKKITSHTHSQAPPPTKMNNPHLRQIWETLNS